MKRKKKLIIPKTTFSESLEKKLRRKMSDVDVQVSKLEARIMLLNEKKLGFEKIIEAIPKKEGSMEVVRDERTDEER